MLKKKRKEKRKTTATLKYFFKLDEQNYYNVSRICHYHFDKNHFLIEI